MGHIFSIKSALLATALTAPFLGACAKVPEIMIINPDYTVKEVDAGSPTETMIEPFDNGVVLSSGTFCEGAAILETELHQSIYADKGQAYRKDQIVEWSYVNVPIVQNGQPRGNSRVWGDATHTTQFFVIETLISAGIKAGMNKDQIAMTIAIARHESGFNPDAAAGTTSAHGIGQFINRTGDHYHVSDSNRWDVAVQANALVQHTLDNYAYAQRKGWSDPYVYALHHDGPSLSYGGLTIAKEHVVPTASAVRSMFICS